MLKLSKNKVLDTGALGQCHHKKIKTKEWDERFVFTLTVKEPYSCKLISHLLRLFSSQNENVYVVEIIHHYKVKARSSPESKGFWIKI